MFPDHNVCFLKGELRKNTCTHTKKGVSADTVTKSVTKYISRTKPFQVTHIFHIACSTLTLLSEYTSE